MQEVHINHIAVFVCAVINLVIGGLWYSPALFYKSWAKEASVDEEKAKKSNPAINFTLAFVLSLLMSYNLAFFIGDPNIGWKMGAAYGFLTGFGWVTLGLAIIAIFEGKSFKYVAINGGFLTVYFTVIGIILAAWR